MKTICINNRSRAIRQLLDIARKGDVLLRTPEGDEFMLLGIDDFDREIAEQRANDKLMRFLDRQYRKGRKDKGIPLEQVARELGVDLHNAKVSRRKTGTNSR